METQNYRAHSPTLIEEEANLKKEFQNLLNIAIENVTDDDKNNEKWGGVFSKRIKTKDDQVNYTKKHNLFI